MIETPGSSVWVACACSNRVSKLKRLQIYSDVTSINLLGLQVELSSIRSSSRTGEDLICFGNSAKEMEPRVSEV